jgi:aspartate racemase
VREGYTQVCENLKQKGAAITIVACTELSALGEKLPLQSIDAAEVLAMEIVQVATNRKPLATSPDG